MSKRVSQAVEDILREKQQEAAPCVFAPICKNTSADMPGKWFKDKFICARCRNEIA